MAQFVFAAKRNTILARSARLDAEFERNERLPLEQLVMLQRKRHLNHARFAFEHTKFYREFYSDAGIRPADFSDPEVLGALPIVEKAHLRDYHDNFVSDEATPRNSVRSTTGGSTGRPLKLLRDLRFPARALEWRLFRWWDVHPYDNLAFVTRQSRTVAESRRHALQWWPSKRIHLNASDMNDESIGDFLRLAKKTSIRAMIGYVGAIAELASSLQRTGQRIPSLSVVGVTAAPLSANQRHLIESVLGAKVYDHYRSAEIPWMGGECSQQSGLHVYADVRALEIVDTNDQPVSEGEVGDVVWTDMTNRVFPLVRYRLGDRSSWMTEPCGCGVTLPRIRAVDGRTVEVLHLPDGQVVAGEGLSQLFSAAPDAVESFQIVQHADHSIDVLYVEGSSPDASREIESAIASFRRIVHDKVPVNGRRVDVIPHVGGKVRYLVSEVA